MPDTFHIQEIENHFRGRRSVSIDELYRFYQKDDSDLERSTLRWRIYKLINKGVLQRVKRGVYTLPTENKKEWRPDVTDDLSDLYLAVRDEFPYLSFCVWTTQWLVPYMHHLPAGYLTILDTEKDSEESVFHFMSDTVDTPVLVNPSKKEMDAYVDWSGDNMIVKRLISQSPFQDIEGVQVPRLEKIMIDLFSDGIVFGTFQGNELKTIIRNLFGSHRINESTLKRYALRRNRWNKFKAALKQWELDKDLTVD